MKDVMNVVMFNRRYNKDSNIYHVGDVCIFKNKRINHYIALSFLFNIYNIEHKDGFHKNIKDYYEDFTSYLKISLHSENNRMIVDHRYWNFDSLEEIQSATNNIGYIEIDKFNQSMIDNNILKDGTNNHILKHIISKLLISNAKIV